MVNKVIFENYKPFEGSHEIEIRPITLLDGKNNSGKSSLTHLICLLERLLGLKKDIYYKHFLDDIVNMYTFHNMLTTGLTLGIENERGCRLSFSFVRNEGKIYLYRLCVKEKEESYEKIFSKDEVQANTNIFDQVEPVLQQWNYSMKDWAFSTDYLGPVRRLPESLYRVKNNHPVQMGRYGENAFELLVDSWKDDRVLFDNVSSWMGSHLDGQHVDIIHLPVMDEYYWFQTASNPSGLSVPIEEVGEGFSQVLPVIVQSYLTHPADIHIVEQPALHLHPAAHACVAERLVESVTQAGNRYIIESHSENILLALRRAVSDPSSQLRSRDVVIYFVDKESQNARLDKIEILDNGDLTSWPTGVFSEGFDLMKDIIRNRR